MLKTSYLFLQMNSSFKELFKISFTKKSQKTTISHHKWHLLSHVIPNPYAIYFYYLLFLFVEHKMRMFKKLFKIYIF